MKKYFIMFWAFLSCLFLASCNKEAPIVTNITSADRGAFEFNFETEFSVKPYSLYTFSYYVEYAGYYEIIYESDMEFYVQDELVKKENGRILYFMKPDEGMNYKKYYFTFRNNTGKEVSDVISVDVASWTGKFSLETNYIIEVDNPEHDTKTFSCDAPVELSVLEINHETTNYYWGETNEIEWYSLCDKYYVIISNTTNQKLVNLDLNLNSMSHHEVRIGDSYPMSYDLNWYVFKLDYTGETKNVKIRECKVYNITTGESMYSHGDLTISEGTYYFLVDTTDNLSNPLLFYIYDEESN